MIGQYLSNNNEKATVPILQKNFASKPAPNGRHSYRPSFFSIPEATSLKKNDEARGLPLEDAIKHLRVSFIHRLPMIGLVPIPD
jgi:hypothetical protein